MNRRKQKASRLDRLVAAQFARLRARPGVWRNTVTARQLRKLAAQLEEHE